MSSTRPNYFLIDCNQFFVSCEQVFNPKLHEKPVVVLSNNDGCAVARSKEAKKLGIPMGAPAYQMQEIFQKHKVFALSSNFALYGDMSGRVMETLASFANEMEEYSIDEAFLRLYDKHPLLLAKQIKQKVLKDTGIPVSIGIGPTKTLAKVANDIAKKNSELEGICLLQDPSEVDCALAKLSPEQIWGIGQRTAETLKGAHVLTALELKNKDESWIRKRFSISLVRTVSELRGIECITFEEEYTARKSITSSRSFGKPVIEYQELEESICLHVAQAAQKLRKDSSSAQNLCVFIATSPFKETSYRNHKILQLIEPTNYTPDLMALAKSALKSIFKPGYVYKKSGVILLDIIASKYLQLDLFNKPTKNHAKQAKAMQVIDFIHQKLGKDSLHFASEGIEQPWREKKQTCSPRFTTSWDELLTLFI